MNSSISIRQIILLVALALMAGRVVAEEAPGQRYIVILKSRSGPPPDVTRLGGKITFRQDDEVIVILPPSALSALKADPLVRYVQTLDGSDTGTAPLAGEPVEPTAGTPGKLTPHTLAGSLSWSRQYAYDPSGNITNIENQQFVYDSLGRLTEMATSGNTTESYVYDRYGNQTSRTTSSGTQAMDVTATTNRLSSGYGYDPAGNVISGDGYTLSYDALGQAATKSYAATTTFNETYVYSASEERIGVQTSNSAESSSWWYWSVRDEGGKVLRQYKTSANDPTQPALWIEDYVWRDGLLLGAERPAILGGRRHFHLDHLGSPRLITSDAGQIVSSHDYLPFGGESSSVYQETGDGFDREDPMKFTGHERDYAGGFGREDGHAIDYMHARYYSLALSRFASVDPFEGSVRDAQSWNRYAYVKNNPVTFTDQDGRQISITVIAPTPVIDPILVSQSLSDFINDLRNFYLTSASMRASLARAALDRKLTEFDHLLAAPLRSQNPNCGSDADCAEFIYQMSGIYDVGGAGGFGGAARTEARNLAEQLALAEAKAGDGERVMASQVMKDPRYPAKLWAKMQHVHYNPDGSKVVIHYWKNLLTGVTEGFKFK